MGFFITEPNTGDYLIQLKKSRKRSTDEVISDIRTAIESTQPALKIDFGQVMGDMLGDLMSSVQPIEIKIFGDDAEKLKDISREVSALVSDVKGTADVADGIVLAGPSISIQPDNAKLAQFGLTPQSLQLQLQTALEGNVTNSLLATEQVSNIRIVYPGSRTLDVNELNRLPVFLPNGKLKLLNELATVKISTGDAQVERENLQTMGVVTARLENGGLGSVMKTLQKNIQSKVHLPPGYYIEYGGAYAEQQQSFKELLMILITSSLLVFGVILFLFRDFRIALLILLIAMLGISGSYLGLFITHTALNVGSYTGLIMIVGIIGENAIFTFLQFKASLINNSVDDSIIYSISTRLRPKLMTALGAIIALMPLALGIGTGAQLHQPLAIAVIGGFVVALPLLLIVLPSMLRILYKNHRPETMDEYD
jgi:Cu/Ag efflux pump CusA